MKIFRDPIHNVINLDTGNKAINDLIIKLIDSKEFQRLRFIKQLGFTYLAYPSATHTRFEHSLGVAFLAKRFLERMPAIEDKNLTIVAALLHDVGHGPLSHTCEDIIGIEHEIWTQAIILGETEINSLLTQFDKSCPQIICDILSSSEVISGQLDVDRMDYLLRDSHMTGSGYGRFDLEWMLNVITVDIKDGKIRVVEKGQSVAEDFEMARTYMYKNVYMHKTGLAANNMLTMLFKRLKDLDICPCPSIKKVFLSGNKNPSELLEDYLSLSDIDLYYMLKQLKNSEDEPVSGLAGGLLNRRLIT